MVSLTIDKTLLIVALLLAVFLMQEVFSQAKKNSKKHLKKRQAGSSDPLIPKWAKTGAKYGGYGAGAAALGAFGWYGGKFTWDWYKNKYRVTTEEPAPPDLFPKAGAANPQFDQLTVPEEDDHSGMYAIIGILLVSIAISTGLLFYLADGQPFGGGGEDDDGGDDDGHKRIRKGSKKRTKRSRRHRASKRRSSKRRK